MSTTTKLKRVYHPWTKWEETRYNMWGEALDHKEMLIKAIEFTGDHNLYGSFMLRVSKEWPISCENALTDYSINRKAWIGHAAVALAIKCPEDITRKAWGKLNNEQQLLANKKAKWAIRQWEDNYRKNNGLRANMEEQMLFKWHSR